MKSILFRKRLSRAGERGSTIVESLVCIMILVLILFGLLQIVQFSLAQMITDYSAFRAARSATVGFNDDIVSREGKLKAVAASGKMVFPVDIRESGDRSDWVNRPFTDAISQFYYERLAIMDYMEHRRLVDYEYWSPQNASESSRSKTSFSVNSTVMGNTLNMEAGFSDYPWNMLMRDAFLPRDRVLNIESNTKFSRHSTTYLE